ncbi:Gfo/Idh/MocA family oxidoreductase [Luteitalea sp.]|uniref:Gfo/Idh/MocA family protein n=1 Tax=Luteitalea sp. TaxID=2004800 RepID=UPI0025BE4943|nr:Gfo/Idh/MocA family oxidoreductase [Luteitalea sp.]
MSHDISRRRFFFYGTLLAGAVPARGYGSVPSLQALGYQSASSKLNVAAIGCGGQGGLILGQAALTENLVALCDVDHGRAAGTFKKFEATPKYKDFRVMLDKEGKNIDACTVGVPDFMHATVALACMQRGKHVYVEKPLTRTPWEARLLQDAAVKYKVATQMGNQGFSHEAHRVAAEIVWSGEIGDITEAHVSTSPGMFPTGLTEPPPPSAVPATLDWDLWLGGAAPRPFSDAYVPYNWRGFLDFGTGQIGNWATHTAGPVHTALKLGAPVSVECLRIEGKSTISMPHRAVVRLDFPARGEMPPVSVYYHEAARPGDPEAFVVPGMENETILPPSNNLADKGRQTSNRAPALGETPAGAGRQGQAQAPAAPAAPRAVRSPGGPDVRVYTQPGGRNDTPQPGVLTGNGSVMVGTKGMLATRDRGEGVWLLPASRWKEYTLPPPMLTRSPGHMLDWVRACKGGDRGCSDFAITAPYAEWLALVVIAWRVPGKLQWDSKNTRFTNSEEANRYVKPMFRKGWDLKL